jgi:hypothetical protein
MHHGCSSLPGPGAYWACALNGANGVKNKDKIMRGISGCGVTVPYEPPEVANVVNISLMVQYTHQEPTRQSIARESLQVEYTSSHYHGNLGGGWYPLILT